MKSSKILLEDIICREVLAENGCTAHFTYADDNSLKGLSESEKQRIVTVMTYNPKTQATFLLKEVRAKDDIEGLMEIMEYAKRHKQEYDSFTILWAKKRDGIQTASYFYCKDALEALEKFYFDKIREEYIIYSVNMSPKS